MAYSRMAFVSRDPRGAALRAAQRRLRRRGTPQKVTRKLLRASMEKSLATLRRAFRTFPASTDILGARREHPFAFGNIFDYMAMASLRMR